MLFITESRINNKKQIPEKITASKKRYVLKKYITFVYLSSSGSEIDLLVKTSSTDILRKEILLKYKNLTSGSEKASDRTTFLCSAPEIMTNLQARKYHKNTRNIKHGEKNT